MSDKKADERFAAEGTLKLTCKYGENGYQVPAALYSSGTSDPLALDKFEIIAGTEPSYNNMCDIDRLLQTVTHVAASFELNRGRVPLISVGVKHGNPCGAAVGDDPVEVARKMVMGDPLAIFGGLIILNYTVTDEVAEAIVAYGMPEGQRRIIDGIIAPAFDESAQGLFKRKGDKCRLLANPALGSLTQKSLDSTPRYRCVRGGMLVQPNYTYVIDLKDKELTRNMDATEAQENDMLLAKAICDTSNSNTITIVRDGMLIGNGVGQQARVRGAKLAVSITGYCGHDPSGASAASDSFFPFTDGVEVLKEAGIKAVLGTSGSVKDKDVADFCKEAGIAFYQIPDRMGRGFFGH